MNTPMNWKKGEDRSWILGQYTIVVVGETSTGKAVYWGVLYQGQPVKGKPSKYLGGRAPERSWDSLAKAKDWVEAQVLVCCQCFNALADDDGFCSDSCETEYNASFGG